MSRGYGWLAVHRYMIKSRDIPIRRPTEYNATRGLISPLAVLSMLLLAALACDIDQKLGSLSVGGAPRKVDAWVGETHWAEVSVKEGAKYEVVIAHPSNSTVEGDILLRDRSTGRTLGTAEGVITSAGLTADFVAVTSGKVDILFSFRGNLDDCTIRVLEIK
jgi:hypothetical protein